MTRTSLSLCALFLVSCTSSPDFDPAQHAESLRDAQLRMRVGEVDEALIITDRILAEDPDNREARLLAAEGSLALSELGRSNTPGLITDGINNYELALELDGRDPDTWIALSRAYLKDSQFEEGRDAARQAEALLIEEEASRQKIAEAIVAAADNEMQIFTDYRTAELQSPDELDPDGIALPSNNTLMLASAVLSRLDAAKQAAPGEAFTRCAIVYQWLGQYSNALSELERGLDSAPNDVNLHIAYQDLHRQMNRRPELVAAYRRLARERAGVSTVQFYLGRAHVLLADQHREQGDWEAATESYTASRDTFEGYRVVEPRNSEATDHWLAICNLSLGRMAYEMQDLDRAKLYYVAAFDNTSQVAELDENGLPLVYDSFGGNYASGLDMVGRSLGSGNGIDALAERLAHYEWMTQRHPDKFGNIFNNAGFLARDLGVALQARGAAAATDAERAAATREAMEVWEKSYAFYQKAVELSPDDPRILNDCGMMLVYYLRRDYDLAAELFERTIEVGQPQIDSLDADSSQEEREFLEEAVGDAYQNMAVMKHDLGRPFPDYKADLERAVAYFPYQRRDAAIILRSEGQRGWLAVTSGSTPDPQDPRKADFDLTIAEASVKADAGDLDGALLVLDGVIREMTGYPPFHYYLGLYSFQYANQARDRGGSAMQVEGLYADATRHLERAVELDGEPVEPRLALAETYYETGEFANAARETGTLLAKLDSDANPETFRTCQILQAKSSSRVFIEAAQAETDGTESLAEARSAFRELEATEALDEELAQSWSTMEQWAGANAEAAAVVARATARFPESGPLHNRLIELGSRNGLAEVAVDALSNRRDAFGVWYRGRARFSLADEQWMGSDLDEAVRELDQSVEEFRSSMAINADYTDSSEQWIALCLGKKGLVLVAQEKLGEAERALLEAATLRPDRIEEPLGGGNTVKRGLMIVGDRYFQAEDLANAQRLFGEASKAVPQDVDFANNHGLFARDYGTELEREDKNEEAQVLFQASYEAYTLASTLEPENVRLLNDRALMLVHHLKRDWEIALDCLERGVVLGEQQLEDPPQDPDDRQVLDEAVGDCYENLGLYHLEHTKDLDTAEANYNKALTFYPTEQRFGTRRGLRRIEELRKNEDNRERDER